MTLRDEQSVRLTPQTPHNADYLLPVDGAFRVG
jgi:hypothetical protein